VKSAQLPVAADSSKLCADMSTGTPRHLADTPPLQRRWQLWTGLGLAVLLVLTGFAWVGSSGGGGHGSKGRAAGATASTAARAAAGAGPTTTAGVATTVAPSGVTAPGPRNLLTNASFESGTRGWKPIGKARLTRSTEATEGGWSVRILADPAAGGTVGISIPDVTLTKLNGRYHTNAWVRPSAPDTTVTIGLREVHDGQPVPGSNTLGWTVEKSGWRHFGAIHVARLGGSRLTLEIMARDLPPGGWLDVDEVVLHLLPSQ
jgi:hypothetical protein